jgi:cytidylate kinase
MIISINGPAGSGKSSVAKKIALLLGWPEYHIGNLRREAARKRGLTLAGYNALGETDPSTDHDVDGEVTRLGKESDDFVIDSRTAWHFIPHSFKVYLDVDEPVGARRILNDLLASDTRNEGAAATLESVLTVNRERRASDTRRYQKYYGFDCYDTAHYDLVVDTSGQTIDDTVAAVMKAVKERMYK